MNPGTLLALLPIMGLFAGFARVRYPRAPLIAAGVIAGLYGLYVAATGIYSAACWDCGTFSGTRGDAFVLGTVFFGITAATTLLAVWLGARFSIVLGRLLRTARELREEIRR
jgi:hypothetical protein